MFREQPRRVAPNQLLQSLQMVSVEWPVRSDRQPDAVQRQRIALADFREVAVRRAASAHVVFGVDFEEANIRGGLHDRPIVLGLEANAGTRRDNALAHTVWLTPHGNLRPERQGWASGKRARPLSSALSLGCEASRALWCLHGRARALR